MAKTASARNIPAGGTADTLEKLVADELAFARERRPPDLQALVERYGGYARIPSDAMADFTASVDAWRRRSRAGEFTEAEFQLRQRRRELGQPPLAKPSEPDPARHASFAVNPDSGGLTTKNIEDALDVLAADAPQDDRRDD